MPVPDFAKSNNVIYIGITNNFERRAIEHMAGKGIAIQRIPGANRLSRDDARALEQAMIEYYGLGKNGGTLINKINSISNRNPSYADALRRGQQMMRIIGIK